MYYNESKIQKQILPFERNSVIKLDFSLKFLISQIKTSFYLEAKWTEGLNILSENKHSGL